MTMDHKWNYGSYVGFVIWVLKTWNWAKCWVDSQEVFTDQKGTMVHGWVPVDEDQKPGKLVWLLQDPFHSGSMARGISLLFPPTVFNEGCFRHFFISQALNYIVSSPNQPLSVSILPITSLSQNHSPKYSNSLKFPSCLSSSEGQG